MVLFKVSHGAAAGAAHGAISHLAGPARRLGLTITPPFNVHYTITVKLSQDCDPSRISVGIMRSKLWDF